MAIAFLDHGDGVGGSGNPLVINCPATVNPNDLLLALGGLVSTTNFGTNPAGWNDLGTTTQGSVRGRFWYKLAAGDEDGDPISFPNTSSSEKTGLIARYSGVDPGDIFDALGTPAGDTGEPYEASVTVVENGSTVVLMMFIDGTSGVNEANATFTGTGGITFRARNYEGGDLVVIGDGVFNAGSHTVGFNSDANDNNSRAAVLMAISLNPAPDPTGQPAVKRGGGVTYMGAPRAPQHGKVW